MNVFNKFAISALKKNKTRTAATIIGIVLATALICAVTTGISSARNFLIDYSVYTVGDWHGNAASVDRGAYDKLNNDGAIEKTTYGKQLGYAVVEGATDSEKPYLYIMGTADNFKEMMPVHLTSGEYPKHGGEIMLPEHFLAGSSISYKIGDTLTLELGDRVMGGNTLNQNYEYQVGEDGEPLESFEVRETGTYTVVGFYERPGFEDYSAPGYTAITADNTSDGVYDVYFKMKNAGDYYSFIEKNNVVGATNVDLLMYSGVSEQPEFQIVLYGLGAIILSMVLFGAISLIYNAFSISVSERTKQFGLLSSIGATKKQIRQTVFYEAFVLSIIAIPLGILVGIGGLGITFFFVGDMFAGMGIPADIPLKLHVTWISVVAACLIALATVFLSALIPAVRATRISAMEAIRQSKDIKISGKDVKTPKLTYKMFGLSGVIATKHFKRNKRKYRTTVISLFISIVLFISSTALVSYVKEIVDKSYGTLGYDIVYYGDSLKADTDAEALLAKMKRAEGVTGGTYYYAYNTRVDVDRSKLTEEYLEDYVDSFQEGDDAPGTKANFVSLVLFVQDAEYRALLEKYSLDPKVYMNSDNPVAIAVNSYKTYSESKNKAVSGKILSVDSLTLEYEYENQIGNYYVSDVYTDENGKQICVLESFMDEDVIEKPYDEVYAKGTMQIGKVIDDLPYFAENAAELILIYPNSATEAVKGHWGDSFAPNFVFRSNDHAKSFDELGKILSAGGLSRQELHDYAALVENSRNVIRIVNVFAYGFIILISLIAATNVFNTISTSISLRRREFAMLRAVGMSKKELNKMMNFECLLYGLKSLLFGLPVSCLITYLIYSVVSEGIQTGFTLPWLSIIIAIVSVFAVVFATMIYAMRKIKKDNPIDALKNENF